MILDEASRNLNHGRHTDTVRFVNRTGHIGDTTRPLLAQVSPGRQPTIDSSRWKESWRGSRPGDRTEAFILYRRKR